MSDRLAAAVAAVDAVNAADPNVVVVDGTPRPKELVHAERMSEWVQRLDPDADEAQLLAARAHHLRRWSIPRAEYPDGRAGYLRWRTSLKRQHGIEVAAILRDVGYGDDVVDRVVVIVRKEGLGRDPGVQVHEDALCLVFLTLQYDELIEKLGDDKAVGVVAKTLEKMSRAAHAHAVELPLSDRGRAVLARALAT